MHTPSKGRSKIAKSEIARRKLAPINPPAAFKDWEFEPGCYYDGARGIHLIDALANWAEQLGFMLGEVEGNLESLADYEFVGEVEDEIDAFFNSRFEIAGHYWGRSENGDWGLWEVELD